MSEMVTADELRQFVERIEQIRAEKSELNETEKEAYAEAKARGYDVKVLRKIVQDRNKSPDELAEFEAIYELYRAAMEME